MKPQTISGKELINNIVCTRYIQGYSEYDYQYRELINNLVKHINQIKIGSNLFIEIEILLGEFNCITKKIYEDIIIELYKIKHKRYPQMEDVYNILINKSIYDHF